MITFPGVNICIHDFDDAKEESNKAASKDKHCFKIKSLLQDFFKIKPCLKKSVFKTCKVLVIDYQAI